MHKDCIPLIDTALNTGATQSDDLRVSCEILETVLIGIHGNSRFDHLQNSDNYAETAAPNGVNNLNKSYKQLHIS